MEMNGGSPLSGPLPIGPKIITLHQVTFQN